MASFLFNVLRVQCPHQSKVRLFKVFDGSTTLSKIEGELRCHPGGYMEISLSTKEDGPWTKLLDEDLYDLPIGVIVSQFPGTKFLKLECVPDKPEEQLYTATPVTNNAFSIMMKKSQKLRNIPSKKRSSSGVPVEKGVSRKDELYNNVIDWMKEHEIKFLDAEKEGSYITQVLTNALWYVTNQHGTINDRCSREKDCQSIPETFSQFQGYNDERRKKMKSQPMSSADLKSHAEALYSLCTRPSLRTTPGLEHLYQSINGLANTLLSYSTYLNRQKDLSETYKNLDHPPRPIATNCSVFTVYQCSTEVKEQYKLLDKALNVADMYEPVQFDEQLHLNSQLTDNMQRKRFIENLQLSATVDVISYCPGGGIITTYCLCKVVEDRSDSKKQTDAASFLMKIKDKLHECHTRLMKKQFRERLNNLASIQGSVCELIYKELALDDSAASHPDTHERLKAIYMGETGLLPDLRKLNTGRPSDKFETFFSKLNEVVEENIAADDRRHKEAHMSQYLSLRDLINQTKCKCPQDTEIPSKSLVRLQFLPRNPYTKTALAFTSSVPIQYKIQRRQLRVSHPDEHFTAAQFKYLRSLAIHLGSDCALYFCDDKAKVPVGEPDVAISTGVRGKKSLAPADSTLVALDHDMNRKASLTPSVYMKCDVPENVNYSFYRGTVTTVINDSTFQSSNPMRHAASLVRIHRKEPKPILLKFTDGGTDHRNNLESVKCASICLFKELNLEQFITCRCAPGQSYINPAERVMSILNIGLQNCALCRESCSEAVEDAIKKCNSKKELLEKSSIIKEEFEQSLEPVKQKIMSRFCRLSLKGEPIQVMDPISDEEIEVLSNHLNHMFPDLNTKKLTKAETSKSKTYNKWIEKHCQERQYSFQIMKCQDPECCSPSIKKELYWLPDPVLDESKDHFRQFEDVFKTETTDQDRPTYQKTSNKKSKPKQNQNQYRLVDDKDFQGDASVFTAQNARTTVECGECSKPRLLYAKLRLNERTKLQVAILISDREYTCGSAITSPEDSLHGKIHVRLNIDCSSPMETSYYSAAQYHNFIRKDLCYQCGKTDCETDNELKKKFKTVYPLCIGCKAKGFEVSCARPFGKNK